MPLARLHRQPCVPLPCCMLHAPQEDLGAEAAGVPAARGLLRAVQVWGAAAKGFRQN
jgi:hypothetical protein